MQFGCLPSSRKACRAPWQSPRRRDRPIGRHATGKRPCSVIESLEYHYIHISRAGNNNLHTRIMTGKTLILTK